MRGVAMEIKKILLLLMLFSHLCVLGLSSSPLHQETLSSDFVQEKTLGGEKTHGSKLEHGIGRGAANAGGTRPNPVEAGNNGGTKTPSTQGGTTFIPVYAAGAANNRHPYHRGAANCNRIGASTLIAATMASLLHLYEVPRWG
ncbi:uncharacterized protein LOC112093994 [Morus notabilis]|uniref:uncharacterized protein LOC112093994 n=1 Tax=Morus notabilis TaxID=981085 RepID=UPI000CED5768|nr:uncharacterized protein LOC112093994 [Morus notabilis]